MADVMTDDIQLHQQQQQPAALLYSTRQRCQTDTALNNTEDRERASVCVCILYKEVSTSYSTVYTQ